MAAAAAAGMPRATVSAVGTRMGSLPVIQHPMSRMDTLLQIEVKGESRQGGGFSGVGDRSKTMYCSNGGGGGGLGSFPAELAQSTQSLPPLSERLASRASTQFELFRDPEVYGTRTPGDKGKFRTSAHLQPKRSLEELVYMIRERLTTGVHAMKHLFISHDSGVEGKISRQALQQLLHSLIGYVSNSQFLGLLKCLGIEHHQTISFEEFTACFADKEMRKRREWMAPVHRKEIIQTHPEEHLRNRELNVRGEQITAPYCLAVLRDTCRKKTEGEGVLNLLPSVCTEPDGRVHAVHLRDVIARCGLTIDDHEFSKLWDRFDHQAAGAVRLPHFLKVLELDEGGRPRPFTTPRYLLVTKDDNKVVKKVKGPSDSPPPKATDKQKESKPPEPTADAATGAEATTKEEAEAEPEEKPKSAPKLKRQASKLRSKTVKLDKILHCLYYKFEENYNALLQGFQLLDLMGDGFISRIDFKQVLEEFGIKCLSTDLEHFFAKSGMRSVRGQVNYREFLNKFWNKTDSGIVHRIITSKFHVFGRADYFSPDNRSDETKKVETLEAMVVEFFHKDFLGLLGQFKRCDKYHIGVVTRYEFKEGVERCLGYSMSETQWKELKEAVSFDSDGLVPYPKFLEQFSATPGLWNKREIGEFFVRQISSNTMAPAIERIKVYSAKCHDEYVVNKATSAHEKSRLQHIKETIERRENGVYDEDKAANSAERTGTTEGESEKATAHEMSEMMSKMQDKPLVNRITDRDPDARPPPFLPDVQMTESIRNDPARMMTPRGPHQAIPIWHRERDLTELIELIASLVHSGFHRMDKAFKAMDRKMTGRFHKGQFNELLQECDLYLSPDEVNRLWATFPVSSDGMFNFSSLLRHFNEYKRKHPFTPQATKTVPPAEPEVTKTLEKVRSPQSERKLSRLPDIKAPLIERENTTVAREPTKIIDKIKADVISRWDEVKNIFRQADHLGTSTVPLHEMRAILSRLQINLNEEETRDLLSHFDFNNSGHFHYIDFLKMYTEKVETIGPVKKSKYYTTLSHKLQRQLIKEWKNIRRAFHRFDSQEQGYLKISDVKSALQSCNVTVTDEELSHILAEFDTRMDGKISYEEFLGALTTTV